ncbi:PREDICTED: protein transport protein SEC31-like [Propithecus coquereli]|uniref:protein transport protein SEC31-like n=1 Tax=Propithecus coquereli TaxID=379532 RepID=UPI00063F1D3C|nr:PREDICTED: protein transport protein SEC31-like [Propithecus coquereli]
MCGAEHPALESASNELSGQLGPGCHPARLVRYSQGRFTAPSHPVCWHLGKPPTPCTPGRGSAAAALPGPGSRCRPSLDVVITTVELRHPKGRGQQARAPGAGLPLLPGVGFALSRPSPPSSSRQSRGPRGTQRTPWVPRQSRDQAGAHLLTCRCHSRALEPGAPQPLRVLRGHPRAGLAWLRLLLLQGGGPWGLRVDAHSLGFPASDATDWPLVVPPASRVSSQTDAAWAGAAGPRRAWAPAGILRSWARGCAAFPRARPSPQPTAGTDPGPCKGGGQVGTVLQAGPCPSGRSPQPGSQPAPPAGGAGSQALSTPSKSQR